MFSRIREHLGIAGLVVAIVALVAALGGAAIAGNSDGGATTSAKAKKGPKGAKGAKGAKGDPGPAGPGGPAGPAGANGKDGANGLDGEAGAKGATGAKGTNGTNGTNGDIGPTGPTGDTGATGTTGATGFSGFTKTLPAGETETGAWGFGGVPRVVVTECESSGEECKAEVKSGGNFGLDPLIAPISFAIPLADPIPGSNVHYVPANVRIGEGTGDITSGSPTIDKVGTDTGGFTVGSSIYGEGIPAGTKILKVEGETIEMTENATLTKADVALSAGPVAGCKGGTSEDPVAVAGHLCVYAGKESKQGTFFEIGIFEVGNAAGAPGASKTGAMVNASFWSEGAFARGTWAVTAPTGS